MSRCFDHAVETQSILQQETETSPIEAMIVCNENRGATCDCDGLRCHVSISACLSAILRFGKFLLA